MIKLCFVFITVFTLSLEAQPPQAIQKMKRLGKSLKAELVTAMAKSPEEALSVCKDRAPKIAEEVSDDNFQVGRVSRKNRNSGNLVQKWMLPLIEKYEEGSKKKFLTVEIEDGKSIGYIKPIKTKALCLNCHGKNISPELQTKIKFLYPNDSATGYSLGDIRGYFWVKEKK